MGQWGMCLWSLHQPAVTSEWGFVATVKILLLKQSATINYAIMYPKLKQSVINSLCIVEVAGQVAITTIRLWAYIHVIMTGTFYVFPEYLHVNAGNRSRRCYFKSLRTKHSLQLKRHW